MYLEVMKKYYGSSTIMITPGRGSNWFMSPARAEEHLGRLDWVVGCTDGNGTYKPDERESVTVYVRGFRIEDLPVFSSFILAEQSGMLPFAGAKLIVSQISARQYGWKLGDTVTLEMNGARRRFTLVGIALPKGVFQEGFDTQVTGVVPREYLAGVYGIHGKVATIYARTRNPADVASMIQTLSREYPRFTVREPLDKAERDRFASGITTPLLLMTIMVLFVSVFIIYSSFKVITVERMPILGTFRSIGATRRTTDLVLILETLLYGVIGGALGCLLGLGILYLMTDLMAYNSWAGFKMRTEIHFKAIHMALAFLLAVGLSFVSSLIPIIRVSRIPVKDIVLNTMDRRVRSGVLRVILGLAALAAALVAPRFVPKPVAFPADAACLFLAIAALVALVPFLTALLTRMLQGLNQLLFGNEGALAARNLRENKNILNNISLIVLSISSLILIFTISFSAIQQTISFYSDAHFQLWAWVWRADRNTQSVIRSITGVSDVNCVYSVDNVEIEGNTKRLSLVEGVDTRTYLDFWDLGIPAADMARLDAERAIMLTYVAKDMLGVSAGDTLTLTIGGGKRRYAVAGFFDSVRNNGSYGIVSDKYLKADARLRWFNTLFIKSSIPAPEAQAAVKRKLARRYPWVTTVAQMRENNVKSNQRLFTILHGFAVMTLVMCVFGVLNNFIISFVERRRHLAIFRSVGMSRRQIVRMMLMESLTSGLVGGLVGCAGGAVLLSVASWMLAAMDLYVTLSFSPPVFLACLGAAVAISVIAALSPAVKSGRMNIIEAIKYE